MMLTAGRGMKVSRPFGVARYDAGVDHLTRSLRVQVKSTIHWRTGHGYSLKLVGSRRKKYERGTVDFFAVLLIPIDEWYIIPFEVIGENALQPPLLPAASLNRQAPSFRRCQASRYFPYFCRLLRGGVAGGRGGDSRFLATFGMSKFFSAAKVYREQ